jgi:hypothetical protein
MFMIISNKYNHKIKKNKRNNLEKHQQRNMLLCLNNQNKIKTMIPIMNNNFLGKFEVLTDINDLFIIYYLLFIIYYLL